MSTLTDKLPKLPDIKLPDIKLPEALDRSEAKKPVHAVVGVVDLTVEQVKGLSGQIKELRSEFSGRVEKATAYYSDLAVRGEKLIGQIRRQPSTEAALAEGKAAVKKAEAAATSANKSVKATEQAVGGAAAKLG